MPISFASLISPDELLAECLHIEADPTRLARLLSAGVGEAGSFRSNAFYYEIYFDWLILLGLIIFFRDYFMKSYLKYLILLIIIAPNIYNNLNAKNFNEINSGSYDKQTYCSNDQIYSENGIWKYYSKKIEKKQILILCK